MVARAELRVQKTVSVLVSAYLGAMEEKYDNKKKMTDDLKRIEDLSTWTLSLLQQFCVRHGLKKSGKKEDVLTR